MPRPKEDADRLKRNRDERRELIDGFGTHSEDEFDELSEITRPDIKIELHHPPQLASPHASPVAIAVPEPRQKSPSQSALDAVPATLDAIPNNQRIWALVALLVAAVVAYAISRGIWGPVK